MSDYTPTVDFARKDTLATNDPAKIILGAEFDLEFNAIAAAIATKTETVPVYPPFDTPDAEGDDGTANIFVTTSDENILASTDFTFTRPDTSFFEYSLCINTNLHGARNVINDSTTGNRVEYKLRLTNLQSSSTTDLGLGTVEVKARKFTGSELIRYDLRYANPNSFLGFTTSTIENLIGASTSGYRAELVITSPDVVPSEGSLFLRGNFSVFIKELFQ